MMSEELNPASVESDSTLTPETDNTPLTAEKIVEVLNAALVELKETGDYLSYATIIEIYLQSKQDSFDQESKITILQGLYNVFNDNTDIVYEIGWDLPGLMIDYLFSEWTLVSPLRDNHGVCQIIKIFELLSLHGNPKEIFLRSCEILNSIKFEEMPLPLADQNWGQEFYFKLASHNLIELLVSSLNRIKTLYPSRFLSKLIITLTNFLNNNFAFLRDTRIIIFRRYYVFIRQYSGLPLPLNVEMDELELARNIEEENYLQRKLLTSFLTYFVAMAIDVEEIHWTYNYYSTEFHNPNSKFRLPKLDDHSDDADDDLSKDDNWDALLLRCAQLAESMDMNLEELFLTNVKDVSALFANLDHSQSIELLNDQVYLIVINNYNESIKPHNKIPLCDRGILYMLTQLVNNDSFYTTAKKVLPVTIEQIIKLTIKYLIPTLINPSLANKLLADAVIFWSWYCIKHDLGYGQEIKKVKPVFINIYLQNLIHLSSMDPNPALRIIIFTLITKTLTMADEQLSWNFIMESIETCPYDNARLALIGILKDLFIRQRSINALTDSLKTISLLEKKDTPKPALPPREIPTYITLTPLREKQLLQALDKQIDEFFGKDAKQHTQVELSILISFVNLLIALKKKLPKEKIQSATTKIENRIKKLNATDDINLSILSVAVESLKKE